MCKKVFNCLSEEGKRLLTAHLDGIVNVDMEDIAVHDIRGVSYVYLGDIGNSDFDRDILTIYRQDK
jgi:hypothetical protein